MSVPSPAEGHGLLALLVLVVFGFAVGFGLLFLCRFPDDRRNRVLLAPMGATVFWTLVGDMLVRAGWTMAQATWVLWSLSIVLALIGAWALYVERAAGLNRETLLIGSTVVIATTLILVPAIEFGLFAYIGFGHVDTLYYNIVAASYWDYGIATDGHLSPFFTHFGPLLGLGKFRNHTFVLLDFLSPLWEAGEPIFVRSVYVFWTMMVGGLCGAYYYRVKQPLDGRRPVLVALYVCVLVSLGWASVPAIFGSWDNALFVPLVPLIAGLLYERPDWRLTVALGLTVGHAFLTYPEGFPVLVVLVPFLWFVHNRQPWSTVWSRYLVGALIAFVVVVPALGPLIEYFTTQLHNVATKLPGGEFAHGLFDQSWLLPAWWAFGAEHMIPNTLATVVLSGGLTAFFLVGAIAAIRGRRDPVLLAVLLLVPVIAYLWIAQHYSYGVYKVLSFGWWLIADLTVGGVAYLHGHISATRIRGATFARAAFPCVVVIVVGGSSLSTLSSRWRDYFPGFSTIELPATYDLTEMREQARRLGHTDAMFDEAVARVPLRAVWIAYGLRSTEVRPYFATRPEYILPDSFVWAKPQAPDALVVGVDERQFTEPALIDTARFDVVPWRDVVARISKVDTPNGAEEWGSWLGTRPIRLSVESSEPIRASLDFDADPGPSRPESMERTLVLTVMGRDVATARIATRQKVSLNVDLTRGTTELSLRCLETPTVTRISNGDERPLLVAIRDLTVRKVP